MKTADTPTSIERRRPEMCMANLNDYTDRAVIREVLERLVDQGSCSMGGNSADLSGGPLCAYRGDGGARCAVGLLMLDSEYLMDMEGRGAMELAPWFPHLAQRLPLLATLQRYHDEALFNAVSEGFKPDHTRSERIAAMVRTFEVEPPNVEDGSDVQDWAEIGTALYLMYEQDRLFDNPPI